MAMRKRDGVLGVVVMAIRAWESMMETTMVAGEQMQMPISSIIGRMPIGT
jgi:hypothetical protein